MTTSQFLLSDVEGGSQPLRFKRVALLRIWRPLPRMVKIFVCLLLTSLLMSSIMLIQWSQLLSSPTTDSSQPDSLDLSSYGHHQSYLSESKPSFPIIPMRPFAKPRVTSNSNVVHSNLNDQLSQNSPHAFSYVKMEGDTIDDDDINWERDLLGKPLNDHQREVVNAMVHSWRGYRKYAWGYDTLKPLSKSGSNWFGVGLTIIDSLDTLLVMGLHQEFKEALDWIEKDLNFHRNEDVNCFEMTIRVLGGLLSAYHLTRSYVILSKAVDVGDRLIHCFDSPQHLVPYSDVNLLTKTPKTPTWSPESSSSEVSTMQVEFRDLARITKQYAYETTTFRTSEHIHNLTRDDPLIPMFINPLNGHFTPSTITLGARADSYYEYLFKQYLQTSIPWLKQDFLLAMDAIRNRLTRQTQGPLKLSFIGEILSTDPSRIHPKMDHLVCFLPGLLALGHLHLTKEDAYIDDYSTKSRIDQLMPMGLSLARTCYYMYNLTATGLSPEIAYFNEEGENELRIRPTDSHNLLRPEYVESLFYLYHITGDEKYRKQGLEIFRAFNKYCKVPSGGYTSIGNVKDPKRTQPADKMESFWTAETLKYFFLLFSDDKQLIDKMLNNYIINTEGHFIKRKYKNSTS